MRKYLTAPGQNKNRLPLPNVWQPRELAAAMGFTGDDAAYEFAGNKTEIIRQIGNAVPVNTACALVKAICDG